VEPGPGEAREDVGIQLKATPAERRVRRRETGRDRARSLQGRRAGFISRVVAGVVDAVVVVAIDVAFLALYAAIRYLFTRHFRMPNPPSWVQVTLFWGIAVIYLTSGWSSTGKTLGKQFAGVRVVRADGGRLRSGRAFGRAVLYGVFPAGLVWALVSTRNASVQDHLLGTVVVYDWTYREAEPNGAG